MKVAGFKRRGPGLRPPRVKYRAPRVRSVKTASIMRKRRASIRAAHPNWGRKRFRSRMAVARRNTFRRRGTRW